MDNTEVSTVVFPVMPVLFGNGITFLCHKKKISVLENILSQIKKKKKSNPETFKNVTKLKK